MNIDPYRSDPLVKEYIQYLSIERGLSDNTRDAYLEDLAKLLSYLKDAHISPLEAKLEHLQDFVIDLSDVGVCMRSVARIVSGVKAFYRFLLITDKLQIDPTELLDAPQIGKHLPTVLTVEEINSIEAAIDLSEPMGHRNKAMIEVLYGCGLRVSEMLGLEISSIFEEEQYISVIGKGNKQRLVPISPPALKQIGYWMQQRAKLDIKRGNEDFLFLNRRGSQLSRVMAFNIIKDLAAKADIEKNISPHTFRHSFATHLLEGGANLRDIQEMLGHRSILTTEIYTHLDINLLRDNIMQFHPFFQHKAKGKNTL